jgi:hypothetical protein
MIINVRVCVLVVHDGHSRPDISVHPTEGDAIATVAGALREAWSAVAAHHPDVGPHRLTDREAVDRWFDAANAGKAPDSAERARWLMVWRSLAIEVVSIHLTRQDAVSLADGARAVRAEWNQSINGYADRSPAVAGTRMAVELLRWQQLANDAITDDTADRTSNNH